MAWLVELPTAWLAFWKPWLMVFAVDVTKLDDWSPMNVATPLTIWIACIILKTPCGVTMIVGVPSIPLISTPLFPPRLSTLSIKPMANVTASRTSGSGMKSEANVADWLSACTSASLNVSFQAKPCRSNVDVLPRFPICWATGPLPRTLAMGGKCAGWMGNRRAPWLVGQGKKLIWSTEKYIAYSLSPSGVVPNAVPPKKMKKLAPSAW